MVGVLWVWCGPLAPSTGLAEDASAQASLLFEKHVRPTLIEHCLRCHGPEKQRGGLRLDSREGWAEGGDSGPAVAGGDMESLLLRAISYEHVDLEMPPRGKLPEETIEAFRRWVQLGAPDPRSNSEGTEAKVEPPSVEEGRSFWSFQVGHVA